MNETIQPLKWYKFYGGGLIVLALTEPNEAGLVKCVTHHNYLSMLAGRSVILYAQDYHIGNGFNLLENFSPVSS